VRVAFTGHRKFQTNDVQGIKNSIESLLRRLEPNLAIQGMAQGGDLLFAEVALSLGIPLLSVRPWAGHGKASDKHIWDASTEQHVVNDALSYPGPRAFHARNHYMIDRASTVLALWDGRKQGGTWAAIKYALKSRKLVIRINPMTQEESLVMPSICATIET